MRHARLLTRFARDERGTITLLMLVLFISILLMTGLALDLAKHESQRADLQSAMDRGTLAAASLRQTLNDDDPLTPQEEEDLMTAMVESYVSARTLSGAAATVEVEANIEPNLREVVASADYGMSTDFFRLVGVSSLEVGAVSRAKEGLGNIEISMVLDTTGSMCNPSCSKIQALRSDAETFINTIFANNPADRVSFNVVPYDNTVNVGTWMFDRLSGVTRDPDQGPCMRMDVQDDLTNALGKIPNYPSTGIREQIDDFPGPARWEFVGGAGWIIRGLDGTCPTDSSAPIRYLSSNQGDLASTMRGLDAGGSTATYFGMQWGLALLNPDSRPLIDEMITANEVSGAMQGRPADWTDPLTDKYLILFTDGAINRNIDLYTPFGESIPPTSDLVDIFSQQCQMARDNGVIVFTIGFELPPGAAASMTTLLEDCASEGRYFPATRDTLDTAFGNIAAEIQRLKLLN